MFISHVKCRSDLTSHVYFTSTSNVWQDLIQALWDEFKSTVLKSLDLSKSVSLVREMSI